MVDGEATGGMTTKPPPWEAREAQKVPKTKTSFFDRNPAQKTGPEFGPLFGTTLFSNRELLCAGHVVQFSEPFSGPKN